MSVVSRFESGINLEIILCYRVVYILSFAAAGQMLVCKIGLAKLCATYRIIILLLNKATLWCGVGCSLYCDFNFVT